MDLKERVEILGLDSTGSSEHGKESTGLTKYGEFLK
jgi:hypothetical protein